MPPSNARKPRILLALLVCVVACAVCPAARAAQPLLPLELGELAHEVGCEPISGFFDRPGEIAPPYLYGYAPDKGMLPEAESGTNAVFWCRRGADFVLVFARKTQTAHGFSLKDSRALLPCPPFLEWPASRGNPPGGLSVASAVGEPLNDFTYADDMGRQGPGGQRTTHPPLQSRYDGAGWDFYCHEGRWLVRPRH